MVATQNTQGEKKMIYAKIISIEYKGEYGDSGVWTDFSYSSGAISRQRFRYEIFNDLDQDICDRIIERLCSGETLKLVSNTGAGCYEWQDYFLLSIYQDCDSDLVKWVDDIEAKYDSIASESDRYCLKSLYSKKWPGNDDLGIPPGFEEAEDIYDLEGTDEDEDNDYIFETQT